MIADIARDRKSKTYQKHGDAENSRDRDRQNLPLTNHGHLVRNRQGGLCARLGASKIPEIPAKPPPAFVQSRVVSGLMTWVNAKVWFCDPLTCAASSGVRTRAAMRLNTR